TRANSSPPTATVFFFICHELLLRGPVRMTCALLLQQFAVYPRDMPHVPWSACRIPAPIVVPGQREMPARLGCVVGRERVQPNVKMCIEELFLTFLLGKLLLVDAL